MERCAQNGSHDLLQKAMPPVSVMCGYSAPVLSRSQCNYVGLSRYLLPRALGVVKIMYSSIIIYSKLSF